MSNRLSGDLIHVSQNMFFRSLGDVIAILTCKTKKVTLLHNATECFNDIQPEQTLFPDPETHLIKQVSTRRQCNAKLPSTIVKSLNDTFFYQEPSLTIISVSQNQTLFNTFDYTFDNMTLNLMVY